VKVRRSRLEVLGILDYVDLWGADAATEKYGVDSRTLKRWAEQRERCPIAFTERRQRTWLPVRYDDLADIAHDTQRFSSHDPIVVSPLDIPINDVMPIPPISSDVALLLHPWVTFGLEAPVGGCRGRAARGR